MLSGLKPNLGDTQELISRVKAEIDCQKLIPDDGTREEFSRYVRQSCINPEHTDTNPTMLIFHDGANCSACGWKGDALDIYRMWHPDAGLREAATALLENSELTLEGGAQANEPRNTRVLDPDLPLKYHFALAKDKAALAGLMAMGFTPQAIQHYKLGLAEVLARLNPDEPGFSEELPDLEWMTIRDKRIPFQRQMRYSVPVFVEGKLRQIIYRKSTPDQLGGKTTMEKDCGAHLMGMDELANASTALFVEGWGDKIICWQWGFTAVTSTNGAGHYNSEWTEALGNVRRLYVVGDADNAGQKLVQRMKRDLPWVRPLKLPWPKGTKKDLRDGWLAGWRKADVMKLMRQADIAGSWSLVAGGAK